LIVYTKIDSCVRMGQDTSPTTTTRALRENLRETLELAARGREIVVTLRGKPYVRILPIAADDEATSRYPLRGSVLDIADDFDAAPARSSSRGSGKRRKR
jgi:prevent-host-death family protein